jgi:sulfur carrier protein
MIEITLNGEKHALDEAMNVAALLERLDLAERRVAVVRNGEVVHREDYASTILSGGEAVDIIQMVGGG